MTVTINAVAIDTFFNDPTGPIATYMNTAVAPAILDEAKAALSRPWPGGRGPFPPPGPPYERSGDLKNSLTAVTAVGPLGPEVDIVPTASHRGADYGSILKARGYRFLPDSYYL